MIIETAFLFPKYEIYYIYQMIGYKHIECYSDMVKRWDYEDSQKG